MYTLKFMGWKSCESSSSKSKLPYRFKYKIKISTRIMQLNGKTRKKCAYKLCIANCKIAGFLFQKLT
jgi:hypothetical protein